MTPTEEPARRPSGPQILGISRSEAWRKLTRHFEKESHKAVNSIKGISAIGIPTSLEVVRSTFRASLMDGMHRLRSPRRHTEALGHFVSHEHSDRTVTLTFTNAEVEIAALADDVIRVSWKPGEPPAPYATGEAVAWDLPDVEIAAHEDRLTLSTGVVAVTAYLDGSIRVCNRAGAVVWEQRPPRRTGAGWLHRARLRSEERIYGLGEQSAPLNLRGHSFHLWNRDPGGSYGPGQDPIYMSIPVYMGVHSVGSYLVFHENSHRAHVTIGSRLEAHFGGGMLRSYVMIGSPPDLLQRFTELTGAPPLPPLWALAYHQSKWGYADENEIEEVARRFDECGIPLSAIHLDLDYMDGFRVFTINARGFPDMAKLTASLLERGIRIVTIVDCGVKIDDSFPVYTEGLREKRFCMLPDGRVATGVVWPGQCAFPDFTDPEVRAWWGAHYSVLLDEGVSGIWHDMNEPTCLAVWGDRSLPSITRHSLEGRGGDHEEAHNLYAVCENRSAFDALTTLRPASRPWILSRSGWAGIQRHAWHWTADVDTSWDGLRMTVPSVLGIGLSGVPYTGSDIGGFSSSPSAELYIRWLQASVFMPFCRTHSSVSTGRREPWCFGDDAMGIIGEFIRLRYRLLPYIYTLAYQTSRTGHPLTRPLWWFDASDPDTWDIDDCFFFGDDLLVAPVLDPGTTNRVVPLPRGSWYDLWAELAGGDPDFGEATIAGGRRAGFATPLDRIPVLVRGGALVPLARDPMAHPGKSPLDIHYFPDESGGARGACYFDDGDGYGAHRLDTWRAVRSGSTVTITRKSSGRYRPVLPPARLVVHGMAPTAVTVDGEALTPSRVLEVPLGFRTISLEGWEGEQ